MTIVSSPIQGPKAWITSLFPQITKVSFVDFLIWMPYTLLLLLMSSMPSKSLQFLLSVPTQSDYTSSKLARNARKPLQALLYVCLPVEGTITAKISSIDGTAAIFGMTEQIGRCHIFLPLSFFNWLNGATYTNGQYLPNPLIKPQIPLAVKCLNCPSMGLMALRQFHFPRLHLGKSNLPSCHPAHLGPIKCYIVGRGMHM